jgi:UDP-GlcNAc:undecaprenyl-phosphate GlcNAc-1-phosphate transferase
MIFSLILWGMVAFAVSFIATVFVKHFAFQKGIIDRPSSSRKIHKRSTARLGGIAIYLGFLTAIVLLLLLSDTLTGGRITPMHYIGILIGGLILMLGGVLDDRFDLPPWLSCISPIAATLTLIGSGIEVEKITNPFGGALTLSSLQSDLLVFVWLLIVMYTTKFLDGLDGLATSVSSVGTLMILLLALTTAYFQPDVALISAVAIGAFLGFLFWNFHPASIFLGEGGSTFVGYILGTLAIISGGKLATALLVLGIPILDVIWVVLRRFHIGGVRQIFRGDRKHLHHRLLDLGLGQRRIVFIYVFVASSFGVSALFLQSRQKLVALILLGVMMLIAATILVQKERS